MRPTLNILSEELIVRILDEARRIMALLGPFLLGADEQEIEDDEDQDDGEET